MSQFHTLFVLTIVASVLWFIDVVWCDEVIQRKSGQAESSWPRWRVLILSDLQGRRWWNYVAIVSPIGRRRFYRVRFR